MEAPKNNEKFLLYSYIKLRIKSSWLRSEDSQLHLKKSPSLKVFSKIIEKNTYQHSESITISDVDFI